jgi:lipoprotein-releasing system permease protein
MPRIGGRLVLSLALRFLAGRRRHQLVNGTARAALIATVIGVAAMVVAMALMSGYRRDLRQKLIGGNAAVMAYPLTEEGFTLSPEVARRLAAVPGVVRFQRVLWGRGSVSRPDGNAAESLDVTLRGVDGLAGLGSLGRLDLGGVPPASEGGRALAGGELPEAVLGIDLARRLGVERGETLRLMVLGVEEGRPRFRFRSVRLAGTFQSGLADFDQRMVVLDRATLERLTGPEIGAAIFEFVIADSARTADVTGALTEILGADYLVRDWQELNAELFAALRLQQLALFFVLGLIVLVSTFNVASSLVVLVRERMREIGVLAALGLTPQQLQGVFLLFGGLISGVGTLGGAALGSGIAWLLTQYHVIRFDPDVAAVYFLSSVSFRVRAVDLAAVVGFTLAVTIASCWLPARRAARVRPAHALRYE